MPNEIVGQLGNLMLVDSKTNGMLKEKPFVEKKKILKERGYSLPEIFSGEPNLSRELIEANTRRISGLSREQVWKI